MDHPIKVLIDRRVFWPLSRLPLVDFKERRNPEIIAWLEQACGPEYQYRRNPQGKWRHDIPIANDVMTAEISFSADMAPMAALFKLTWGGK